MHLNTISISHHTVPTRTSDKDLPNPLFHDLRVAIHCNIYYTKYMITAQIE